MKVIGDVNKKSNLESIIQVCVDYGLIEDSSTNMNNTRQLYGFKIFACGDEMPIVRIISHNSNEVDVMMPTKLYLASLYTDNKYFYVGSTDWVNVKDSIDVKERLDTLIPWHKKLAFEIKENKIKDICKEDLDE